jgi:hypothetical protein
MSTSSRLAGCCGSSPMSSIMIAEFFSSSTAHTSSYVRWRPTCWPGWAWLSWCHLLPPPLLFMWCPCPAGLPWSTIVSMFKSDCLLLKFYHLQYDPNCFMLKMVALVSVINKTPILTILT